MEYDQVKEMKNLLRTLRIEAGSDVPIGARRREDVTLGSLHSDTISNDPDVWPPPTPVDHRSDIKIIV